MQDPVLAFLKPRDLELGPKTASGQTLKHWRVTRDADNVAWALLDRKGASANTLSEEVITELDNLLDRIEADPPKGLVIRSAKPSGFIAGADVSEFNGATDADVERRTPPPTRWWTGWRRSPCPIAVAHGYCLGGGLEMRWPPPGSPWRRHLRLRRCGPIRAGRHGAVHPADRPLAAMNSCSPARPSRPGRPRAWAGGPGDGTACARVAAAVAGGWSPIRPPCWTS